MTDEPIPVFDVPAADATDGGPAGALDDVVNLAGFEALARAVMTQGAFDYVAGGSGDEVTLAENELAFRRRRLRPRVLIDVSLVDTSASFLGRRVSMPVGHAPVAQQGWAHPEGEVAVARAAAAEDVLMCLSTVATQSLEEVAEANGDGPRWFQLYVHQDRVLAGELVRRAAAGGYAAIALTADMPLLGRRERDVRNRLAEPAMFGNFAHLPPASDTFERLLGRHDPGLTWDDIAWLRSLTELPVIVKGILTGEDARLAVEHGAAAVVVSNHGGRQLDRVHASIDVLEEVVEAVGGRVEVYLDGGVRRATDVLMALALGARGVFIGRPYVFALAAGGEAGVGHALRLLRAELATCMALLGVTSVSEVTRAHID